jgi:chorismate dehydratase
MAVKLGYIDYLNCYPFHFHMFERQPVPGVEIVPAYPSSLNAMLGAGELDMSAISAGALGDLGEAVFVMPHFCLSSVGYVHSVLLRSNLPIEDLDGRAVGITRASRTSEVLLKVLLERYYKVRPNYTVTDPNPSMEGLDAALLIGNEAMKPPARLVPFTYDLGELWLRKTGFPVVFAVFAIHREGARRFPSEIAARGRIVPALARLPPAEEDVVLAGHAPATRTLFTTSGPITTSSSSTLPPP